MYDLQDPRELSLAQVFRQARMLARHTSRGTNPDWYRPALDLDRQWHILIDGQGQPLSYVLDRRGGTWIEGPDISLAHLGIGEEGMDERSSQELQSFLQRILEEPRLGGKPRSLGVVVHIADEMAIADLSVEFSSESDFERVRSTLEEAPRAVIADSTLNLDAHTWKILPQWGQRHGERRSVAILLSRRLDEFLRKVARFGEERNLPVIPQMVSAPLSTLMMLPLFLDQNSSEGDIIVLHYPKLTVLVVLDSSAELRQLRALPHRPDLTYPDEIGEIIGNAAASMNLKAPKVHVVALGNVNSEALLREIMSPGSLAGYFGIEVIEPSPGHLGLAPAGRPELMLGNLHLIGPRLEQSVLARSSTFRELAAGWATQNFDRGSVERTSLFPSRGELVLLKLIDKAKITFATLALCVSLIATYEGAGISGKSAKETNRATLDYMRTEIEQLQVQDKKITYWESMMVPRSEAWGALELVLRMIPSDGSILLTSIGYTASGEPPKNRANKRIAFRREWTLKGYCRSNARAALTQLSSNRYVRDIFDAMATEYSRDAFRSNEKTRSLVVTMQQRQGDYPPNAILAANAARLYNTCFDIKVTQGFGDKDDLAILISPPRQPNEKGVAP